ncbi:MAG: hypothetical protein PHI98_03055 [Eubacteriales bacterium]|nr:hypothetical protein [Eubacteriales bacterium]
MQIHTEQEALYIACEMETGAVQLYARALHLLKEQGREQERLYYQVSFMHSDEQEHLRQFRALYNGLDVDEEQRLTLSAVAEGVLFEGGLMGAVRNGLLTDAPSMLRYALEAEKVSAQKYREFAALADTQEARSTLLLIAAEEDKHERDLEMQAELAKETEDEQ